MFRNLSESISLKLITNKLISMENREYYIYGLELFLSKITFYVTVIALSLLTQSFIISVLFLISYMLLRQYTGGYHCKTSEVCFIFSLFIYLLMVFMYKLESTQDGYLLCCFTVVSFIVILIFSPIVSVNNPLTIDEKKKYRLLSILISFVYVMIVVISMKCSVTELMFPVSWSLTADAVLILMSKVKGGKT